MGGTSVSNLNLQPQRSNTQVRNLNLSSRSASATGSQSNISVVLKQSVSSAAGDFTITLVESSASNKSILHTLETITSHAELLTAAKNSELKFIFSIPMESPSKFHLTNTNGACWISVEKQLQQRSQSRNKLTVPVGYDFQRDGREVLLKDLAAEEARLLSLDLVSDQFTSAIRDLREWLTTTYPASFPSKLWRCPLFSYEWQRGLPKQNKSLFGSVTNSPSKHHSLLNSSAATSHDWFTYKEIINVVSRAPNFYVLNSGHFYLLNWSKISPAAVEVAFNQLFENLFSKSSINSRVQFHAMKAATAKFIPPPPAAVIDLTLSQPSCSSSSQPVTPPPSSGGPFFLAPSPSPGGTSTPAPPQNAWLGGTLSLALFGISLALVVLLAPSFLLAFLAKGTLRFVLGHNDPSQDKPFHSRIKPRERDED